MDATGMHFHRLPRLCFVVLPGLPAGGNIAICVRGEQGVRLTRMDMGQSPRARSGQSRSGHADDQRTRMSRRSMHGSPLHLAYY